MRTHRVFRTVSVVVALVLLVTAASEAPAAPAPVRIGFLNQERGPNVFPENSAGARGARDYVNTKLNGVNGHALTFVNCTTDGSPEASIDCANRFVEAGVVAVLMGVDLGSDAALPILTRAHIPFVAYIALGSAQSVSKDAFFFGAPTQAAVAAPMKLMAQRMGVKSLAFIAQDNVVARTSLIPQGVAPAATKLKLALTTVLVDPANPDYTQAVTTALASRPDALFFTSSETDCSRLITVIRQLQYQGPVFSAGCTAFIPADPTDAEGVFSVGRLWVQSAAAGAGKIKAAELKAYAAAMAKRAPQYATTGGAQRTFAATVDLARVLEPIEGRITATAVLEQLRRTRDLPGFMGQPINCDGKQWPGQPTACGGGVLVFRVHAGAPRAFSKGFVYAADVVSP
jgi:branched-chain amino acid transport system substrate-binding protein